MCAYTHTHTHVPIYIHGCKTMVVQIGASRKHTANKYTKQETDSTHSTVETAEDTQTHTHTKTNIQKHTHTHTNVVVVES